MRAKAKGSGSAQNHSYISTDSLIHNIYIGNQNATTVILVGEVLNKLIKQLRSQDRSVLIFSDISKLGKTPLSARRTGLEIMRGLDFDKAAIYGPSSFEKNLVNMIVIASGRGFQIKYFTNPNDAKSWLLS